MNRLFGIIGAALLGLSVILGAFGAHWLEANYPARSVELFQTATLYQSVHGLGILILWVAQIIKAELDFSKAIWCFTVGCGLFSGSLYLLAVLPEFRWLGMITPFGGLLFIAGWILAIIQIAKAPKN